MTTKNKLYVPNTMTQAFLGAMDKLGKFQPSNAKLLLTDMDLSKSRSSAKINEAYERAQLLHKYSEKFSSKKPKKALDHIDACIALLDKVDTLVPQRAEVLVMKAQSFESKGEILVKLARRAGEREEDDNRITYLYHARDAFNKAVAAYRDINDMNVSFNGKPDGISSLQKAGQMARRELEVLDMLQLPAEYAAALNRNRNVIDLVRGI